MATETTVLSTRPLKPFGICIEHADPWAIDPETIHELVREHRVVVLRRTAALDDTGLARWSARLGMVLRWEFGDVNDLRVRPDKKNYLYTNGEVPLHWDGAFASAVPRYLVFQCREAPVANQGGETVFVDAVGPFRDASEEQRTAWQATAMTYDTEKVVHYGGKITQPLVDRHPLTDEPVLRFAEPVDGLNPVDVAVSSGLYADYALAIHVCEQPQYRMLHVWEVDDIVVADNHALLHGRTSYANDTPRRLARVNVLGPGSGAAAPSSRYDKSGQAKRRGLRDIARDSMRLRRPEFLRAELPILLIPLAWSCLPGYRFDIVAAGSVALLLYLLFNLADLANCWTDRELDAVFKTYLADAVARLGKRQIMIQVAASAVGAFALTGFLAWRHHDWRIGAMVVVGAAFGVGYSVPPVRFKGRGVQQILIQWAIIFFGPMALVGLVMTRQFDTALWYIAAAFGLLQSGVILLNNAEDEPEDRASGVRTAVVALGVSRSMRVAALMAASGSMLMIITLALSAFRKGSHHGALAALGAIPFAIVVARTARRLWQLANDTDGASPGVTATLVRSISKEVPNWLTHGAWTALLATILSRI